MAGTPNQLMPVGRGLALHELAAVSAIPLVELKVVKRHGQDIATAALAIRDGVWSDFSDIKLVPICFLPCAMQAPRFGGSDAARTAVRGLPRAKQCKVALGSALTRLMESIKEAQ